MRRYRVILRIQYVHFHINPFPTRSCPPSRNRASHSERCRLRRCCRAHIFTYTPTPQRHRVIHVISPRRNTKFLNTYSWIVIHSNITHPLACWLPAVHRSSPQLCVVYHLANINFFRVADCVYCLSTQPFALFAFWSELTICLMRAFIYLMIWKSVEKRKKPERGSKKKKKKLLHCAYDVMVMAMRYGDEVEVEMEWR